MAAALEIRLNSKDCGKLVSRKLRSNVIEIWNMISGLKHGAIAAIISSVVVACQRFMPMGMQRKPET
jgi:hypothetical protein